MATDLAPVTPEVLAWARQSVEISLEDAAKRVSITPERMAGWEAGDEMPTLAKLRVLAKAYQRPLSIFFLPEAPRDYDTLRDFRRLPDAESRRMSLALHKVHRRAVEQQQTMLELLEEEGESYVVGLGSAEQPNMDHAEDAAADLRARLGISVTEQRSWPNSFVPFNEWMGAAEALGVLVMRTSEVDPQEMRGFSVHGDIPVVVVNALDWPRGQVFTLIHELAHLMLRDAGVCNLLDDPEHHGQAEMWCNAVAASTLMPRAEFIQDVGEPPTMARSDWSDGSIQWLSERWSVSQESVARRLVTLGYAPPSFYDAKRAQYSAAYAERREEEKRRRRAKNSQGGPPPARMAARDRGKPYVRVVLDAYHRRALTESSTSSILGLKVKHLRALENEVRG